MSGPPAPPAATPGQADVTMAKLAIKLTQVVNENTKLILERGQLLDVIAVTERERDEAREKLATTQAIARMLQATAIEILAAYESGTVVSGELLGIWRERLGQPEHPEGMLGNWRKVHTAYGQWTICGYDEKGFACLDEACPACSAQALIVNEENAAECLTCAWRESASTKGGDHA